MDGECEDERCPKNGLPVWHCVACGCRFCQYVHVRPVINVGRLLNGAHARSCWLLQKPHTKEDADILHEKADPRLVQQLGSILSPAKVLVEDPHKNDRACKWFGLGRDATTGQLVFEDHGRYAALMVNESSSEAAPRRYPHLVSFVGATGAGKSSLIRMLIAQGATDTDSFPGPVVGSATDDTEPTSGDVHLYADPTTCAEEMPILYADCEGFEGGVRTPLGSRSRQMTSTDIEGVGEDECVQVRPIMWLGVEASRESVVATLFPRLLYTFSDCVVFVLRNAKTFQSSVLSKLLDWGNSALERSINQPVLPHCIVALNATDPSVDEWDVDAATQKLLLSVKDALKPVALGGEPRCLELAESWRSFGKHIHTVKDLIDRYYSSFKVVRIPTKPKYTSIQRQVAKLHSTIKTNCSLSLDAKGEALMHTDAQELDVYLQSGFDHFTTHRDKPFDFLQVSLLCNPIATDFGKHILQLFIAVCAKSPPSPKTFEQLTAILASCVLPDLCTRLGSGTVVDRLLDDYEAFFALAIKQYLEMYYPCSYRSGTRRCTLGKARHRPKGHQDQEGIFAAGEYQMDLDAQFEREWIKRSRRAMEVACHRLPTSASRPSRERVAWDIHLERLNKFFRAVDPSSAIRSHATCLCCVRHTPEHPLPCGHVLCTSCLRACGEQFRSGVLLRSCPLHGSFPTWSEPVRIALKPKHAGVRVLSLDSGGIRGIVQLEVLRALQVMLGKDLPIQAFFDLIVGAGTGALIAVALLRKDKTIDLCTELFIHTCESAYSTGATVRKWVWALLRHKAGPLQNALLGHKAGPLQNALKNMCTEDEPFFGPGNGTGCKVALVCTSPRKKPVVLANYRRAEDEHLAYSFERSNTPELEPKTWECLAATFAAPSYSSACASPAAVAQKERVLVWREEGAHVLDLFLSLGTGKSAEHRDTEWGQLGKSGGADDRKFIRLNPDLNKPLLSRDNLERLNTLRGCVQELLRSDSYLTALGHVVNRLIASCFYFEPSHTDPANASRTCPGAIVCRWEDGTRALALLGEKIKKQHTPNFTPYFEVWNGPVRRVIKFTPDLITQMTGESAAFALAPVYIPLHQETLISLALVSPNDKNRDDTPTSYPISGFPRVISTTPTRVSLPARPDIVHAAAAKSSRRSWLYPPRWFDRPSDDARTPANSPDDIESTPPSSALLPPKPELYELDGKSSRLMEYQAYQIACAKSMHPLHRGEDLVPAPDVGAMIDSVCNLYKTLTIE